MDGVTLNVNLHQIITRLVGVPPHVHQANILKCPQNENFIILQLFIRIQLIFFVLENYQFLKLMNM
ncbi:hypothetical protein COE04_01345 [Bacillus cereus]|nr:hypothetical protein COE04_01345 [Bacillus cereus]